MKSNNSVISAIADNWQLDAMQENMCKYFFSDKDLSLVKDGKKCYVIGRKGAGKSAICQYLVNNPNYNQFAQKLTFKISLLMNCIHYLILAILNLINI